MRPTSENTGFRRCKLVTSNNVNGVKAIMVRTIAVLASCLILVMSYVFISAIGRNDRAHMELKSMLGSHVNDANVRIGSLESRVDTFFQKAPPPHVHLKDGTVSKDIGR